MTHDSGAPRSHKSGPKSGPTSLREATLLGAGDVIGGHYVVEELLGEGGMAIVYRARNASTGKPIALKVLQAQLGEQPEFVRMFSKEAKIGSVVGDNDHIVQVYDAGLDPDRGLPFIVMELLEGENLEQALEHGPLPGDVARTVLDQLGTALTQAHEAGVIHRDLKPSNLFLSRNGDDVTLKVMDFGIAKVLQGGAVRTATQIGTPAYTAPEQMGATTRKIAAKQGITIATGVSAATDIWALGLIAYEIFTGEHPGHYWGFETLTELPMKIAFEELEPASVRAGRKCTQLPAGFDEWFATCLRKNAAERYGSAREAIDELLALDTEVIDLDQALTIARVSSDDPTRAKTPASRKVSATVAAAPLLPSTAREPDAVTPAPSTVTRTVSAPSQGGMSMGWMVAVGAVVAGLGITGYFATQSPASSATACLDGDMAEANEQLASQCETACDSGSLESCNRLAELYEDGRGASSDETRARELFSKACGVDGHLDTGSNSQLRNIEKHGCASPGCVESACADLGKYYEQGRGGVTKSSQVASALFKRTCLVDYGDDAAERGVAGCVGLGNLRQLAGSTEGARVYYRAACDKGELKGCVGLAGILERGTDHAGRVVRDEKSARALLQRACDGGELSGCVKLGKMVERGRGGWVKDEGAGIALYERACKGGEEAGCVELADAYKEGRHDLPNDPVRAAELLTRACESGELTGCAHLATMTSRGEGGLSKDGKRTFGLNRRACDGGELLGCAQLANMYLEGEAGLTKDVKEAGRLLEKACQGGEALGCVGLARIDATHDESLGHEIESLLSRACEEGEPEGCLGLAEMLEEGRPGLPQDLERSAALYTKACDVGSPRACTNLANLTYQGLGGIERDAEKSFALNDKACKGGDSVGCARLGLLYALGQGVTKDKSRAAELHKTACTNSAEEQPAQRSRCELLQKKISETEEAETEAG